jgi:hypothetical protein
MRCWMIADFLSDARILKRANDLAVMFYCYPQAWAEGVWKANPKLKGVFQ